MHRRRPEVKQRFPVHVTMRIADGVRSLRKRSSMKVVERAFWRARGRFGLRMTHFSVQGNHVHLIVESTDKDALRRAVTGLNVRIARGMNKLMGRKGQVIAHRYHAHILRTPAEVRNAVNYVRRNFLKHTGVTGPDECCSDWRPDLVVEPRTWLLGQAALRPS
jgi:REP element-mobilizing transposase RayT